MVRRSALESIAVGRFFRVKGRVTYADGTPAEGVWLALVDEDPECDDLLGVGATSEQGAFELTFTRESFNQEEGENEDRPDLYVVASLGGEKERIAVLRRDFPGLAFEGEEDLGMIALPLQKGDAPVAVPGLRPAPGQRKLVRRVHLDDELVAVAAREIVGLVESLTGFSNLLDGVRFDLVDDFVGYELARLDANVSAAGRRRVIENAELCGAQTFARWDSSRNTIVLNRPALELQNYDGLRVILGHELAHVGQSKLHPEVELEYEHLRKAADARTLAGEEAVDMTPAELGFMSNIEGHATYVEEQLRRVFTHAAEIANLQLTARLTQVLEHAFPKKKEPSKRRSWGDILESSATSKRMQYASGVEAYRAKGDARFDPALRPKPHYRPDVKDALQKAADEGDRNSQLELGLFLLDGHHGYTADPKRGAEYFEKAAAQGSKAAVQILIDIYEKGRPVPRDLVKAAMYKKKLAKMP